MATLESHNPTTGELLGSVESVEPGTVQGIVDDVAAVQPFWGELALADRARYLAKVADVLQSEANEVADLICAEQGKALTEAWTMEVIPTIDALGWIADRGPEILADRAVKLGPLYLAKKAHHSFAPIGVVGVIAPWNYPWSIPFGEVAIALMCGNGVVLKPSTPTALIGERIGEVFARAGIPEGLVRIAHGGGDIGAALVESSARKIFFTGSVETGRKVGQQCASQLKGSVLELGGKDPAIICADCDMDQAVAGAVWGGFANAGQTCAGIERLYVVSEVHEEFQRRLVESARELRVGDPASWEIEMGPMVTAAQHELVRELVDDAVENGAELLCGGPIEVDQLPGKFFAPTVLAAVTPRMRIMREEIFGPVLPVIEVESEDEAIELANDSDFGLGASVWTSDRRKGERMAKRLEAGMVWINDHAYSHAAAATAWGGIKDSGIGRTHSEFGFYECSEVKLVAIESGHIHNYWWPPYSETLGEAIRSTTDLLYGSGAERLGALREGGSALLKTGLSTLRRSR
ncbi:MAG: aldehyde dehydrogenase family protein [Solirubrobacterales bacterium]